MKKEVDYFIFCIGLVIVLIIPAFLVSESIYSPIYAEGSKASLLSPTEIKVYYVDSINDIEVCHKD